MVLSTVEVETLRYSDRYEKNVSLIESQLIAPHQIITTPGLFDDPARAVQILKSAIPASDYNSYYAIRGGSPDQNLIILDGVVIPNPYRFRLALGGGMSIFDMNISRDVRLHTGGFSAEFGNTLSSISVVCQK